MKLKKLIVPVIVILLLTACGTVAEKATEPTTTFMIPYAPNDKVAKFVEEEVSKGIIEETTIEYEEIDNYIPFEGTVDYYEEVYYQEEEQKLENFYTSPKSSLSMDEFYWMWYNMEDATWEECLALAANYGMDEYSLLVAAGWTVNEGYTWVDPYLAYLCAMCPYSYLGDAWTIANGLAGWDYSGTYSVDNLSWQGYNISQTEINLLYLSLKYPQWGIFCCDGLSWYNDAWLIYSNWDGYYIINVWSY